MIVKRVALKNFRGIREMDLEFQPDINVLVGENGAGKSSVLDALAILLSRLVGRIGSSKGTGRFFKDTDIKKGALETANTIGLLVMGQEISWRVVKSKKGRKKQTISNLDELRKIVEAAHEKLERDEQAGLPLAVFYAVNRSVLEVPLRIRKRHDFSQLAAYDQALTFGKTDGRNDFKLFFEWFRNREDLENEMARYQDTPHRPESWEFPDRQLEAVRKAVKNLMPGYENLRVHRAPMRMVLEKEGRELRIDQLSDGEKCTLALVGDLARRLAIANPALPDPLQAEGVVLIDEIDLHLHPKWQRLIIPKLHEAFPKCQLIVTTHSPQVISHVEAEKVFLLRVTEDNIVWSKPEVSYGQESNRILEDLMGVPARPNEIKEEINKIFVAIDEGNLDKARSLQNGLKKRIIMDPELIKADVLIKRKARIGK